MFTVQTTDSADIDFVTQEQFAFPDANVAADQAIKQAEEQGSRGDLRNAIIQLGVLATKLP